MRGLNKGQVILLVGGVLLFGYTLYVLGGDSIGLISANFEMKYMWVYIIVTLFSLCPLVWRWQTILNAYGKRIGFWTLLRIQLAGYAVSYVTPAARIGGEPLRIYMLQKDCKVDYKTGTVSVILDKYMEYVGSITFGLIGLTMVFLMPDVPMSVRWVLGGLVIFSLAVLSFIYYRLSQGRGIFLSLFSLFLSKKRLRKMKKNLKDIDGKMNYFVGQQKRAFFISYLFYAMSGFMFLIEYKYLLLSFGVTVGLFETVLISIGIGLAALVPIPMALGSLEAGQSGLFHLLRNDGSIGLALSLIHRVRGMVISAVGFVLIMIFSGKDIIKKSKKGS